MANQTKYSLDNVFNSLTFTVEHFRKILVDIHHNKLTEGYSVMKVYKQYLVKTKLIYHNMNKMKPKGSLLMSLLWVPKKYVNNIKELLLNDEDSLRGV